MKLITCSTPECVCIDFVNNECRPQKKDYVVASPLKCKTSTADGQRKRWLWGEISVTNQTLSCRCGNPTRNAELFFLDPKKKKKIENGEKAEMNS